MDSFSIHKISFFYAQFPPTVAHAYLQRMEIIYTPAHGSWLNMADIEFSARSRQVLNRSFAHAGEVRQVVEEWKIKQNAKPKPRNWQFKTADARSRLAKLYPTI